MGLAARKEKQRIGADPRNLTWSEDKSRFGQQYLAKFGWTPESGAGLGANGDGRLKHISVVQKLNLLGIGTGQGALNNPDGVAYKQSNDFERMLKRLNQGGDVSAQEDQEEKDERMMKIIRQGFVPADKTDAEHTGVQLQEEDVEMVEVDKKTEKERRKEEKRKKKLLKQQKEQASEEPSSSLVSQPSLENDSSTMTPLVVSVLASKPRMAHRAKFRASKQLASLSSAALSEILGVSSSASTSAAPSHMATPPLLPPDIKTSEDDTPSNTPEPRKKSIIEEHLTTSSTSVADYFAAKLKARKAQMAEAMSATPTNEVIIQQDSTVQGEEKDEVSTRRSEKREKKKEKKRKREAKDMEVDETNIEVSPEPQEQLKEERLLDEEPLKKKKKKRKQDA